MNDQHYFHLNYYSSGKHKKDDIPHAIKPPSDEEKKLFSYSKLFLSFDDSKLLLNSISLNNKFSILNPSINHNYYISN